MDENAVERNKSDCLESRNDRIPKHLCGLDFCFHVFNKMYIQDIISMEECSAISGMYWYKRHPIYKVDLIGVVVKKQENARCFVYGVDDGTGVITCCCWKNRLHDQSSEDIENTLKRCRNLPKVLKEKMSSIMISESKKREGYDLGDLVHIRGKIKIFRGEREVVASYHNKLDDPNMEIVRMSELLVLYKTQYDVDTLPKEVLKEIKEVSSQSVKLCQGEIGPKLKEILVTHVECNRPKELNVEKIIIIPEVTELFKEQTQTSVDTDSEILKVLEILEVEGRIFTKQKNHAYEVINPGCPLENLVMDILKRDCVREKFQNGGCHQLHIVDEVRKSPEYSSVKNACVKTCLNNLECQSEVIRTSLHHYYLCTI